MDFNLSQLQELFEKILEIVNSLEKQHFFDKSTRIYFANGDTINYKITRGSIVHLLGVDTNYLSSTGLFSENNSYQLLVEMCQNAFKINQLKSKGSIDYNNLFSKHIIKKIESFWSNIRMNTNETEFVCKYDSSRSYQSGEKIEKFDYAIIKNINDKYYVLWLVKNDDGYVVPMSNQVFDSKEEMECKLEKMFTNQELTLMTTLSYEDGKKFFINGQTKENKVTQLIPYKKKYACSVDVMRDYLYEIRSGMQFRENNKSMRDIIDYMIKSINTGKLIDPYFITNLISDGNEKLLELVNAYNDFLARDGQKTSSDIGQSYTSLVDELSDAKRQLLEAKKIIEEQNRQIANLTERATQLSAENAELNDIKNKVFMLVKPKENQLS